MCIAGYFRKFNFKSAFIRRMQGLNMNTLTRNGQLATILPKPPADGVTMETELVSTETSSGIQYHLIEKAQDEALAPMDGGDMPPCIDEAANAG